MAKRTANIVKIWVDSLGGTKPSMSPEIYRAVIQEAHKTTSGGRACCHDLVHVSPCSTMEWTCLPTACVTNPSDQELISSGHECWAVCVYTPMFTVDGKLVLHLRRASRVHAD